MIKPVDQVVFRRSGVELLKREEWFWFSGFIHFKIFSFCVGMKYPQSGGQETKESGSSFCDVLPGRVCKGCGGD